MRKRSKKHHFVPKVLQRAFQSRDDHIWYAMRGVDGRFCEPEDRNIGSTFRLKDLYTVIDENGVLSDEVERLFYGTIDNYLGQLIPSVLDAFSRKEVPTFDGKSLESLQRVTYEMIKRTPEFTKRYDDLEIGKGFVQDMLNIIKENPDRERKLYFESCLSDENNLRKLGRSIRVKGMIRRSEEVVNALADFSVRWAVIDGKSSFVLSSLIAYRIGNGGSNGISNPNMEIWIPISPKHAIVLTRDPLGKIPLVVDEPANHVRQVNEFAVRNSAYIASHSQKLLTSLVRHGGVIA